MLARLPPCGHKAIAHQHRVEIGQRGVKALGQRSQHKTSSHAKNESDDQVWQQQRNHAHFALFTHAAPPVPPAIEREDDEKDLQQCVGKKPRAKENHHVEKDGDESDGPADEQTPRSQPDSKSGRDGSGEFQTVRGEVSGDGVPDHG